MKKTVNVKFAGRSFQVAQQVKQPIKAPKQTNSALDSLVNMIDNQDKNINALQKTKMDWETYTKDKKLEDELEKNRKDGYLTKQAFKHKAQEVEYQYHKEAYKKQVHMYMDKTKKEK